MTITPRKALAQAWNDPTTTTAQVRELLAQVNPAAPTALPRRRSGESYAQAAIRIRKAGLATTR